MKQAIKFILIALALINATHLCSMPWPESFVIKITNLSNQKVDVQIPTKTEFLSFFQDHSLMPNESAEYNVKTQSSFYIKQKNKVDFEVMVTPETTFRMRLKTGKIINENTHVIIQPNGKLRFEKLEESN